MTKYLPYRLLAVGTSQGSIFLFSITTNDLTSRLEVPGGGSILRLLTTSLHLIAVKEGKEEPNQYLFYELNDENSTIKIVNQTPTKQYTFKKGKIRETFYTQSFEDIIVLCTDGSAYSLPIKAEKREENEDEAEGDGKKNIKPTLNIHSDPTLIGVYHCSRIIFCEELRTTNKMVSASTDGLILVNNMENGKMSAYLKFNSILSCASLSPMGNLLAIGSNTGVLRILDLTDPKTPRLIMSKKIFTSKGIKVAKFSVGQEYIGIIPEDSSEVYFISGLPGLNFQLYGFVTVLQGTILDGSWSITSPLFFSVVSKNGLLTTITLNEALTESPTFKELPSEIVTVKSKKIDFDINQMAVDPDTSDIFCTGEEKTVRRYKVPEELLQDMDSRLRAPFAPVEEVDGHELATNYFQLKQGTHFLVSGGSEGAVILRSSKSISESQLIYIQNSMTGGVSACSLCETQPLVLAGGFDGSLTLYKTNNVSFAKDQNRFPNMIQLQDGSKLPSIVAEEDHVIKYYEVILEQENRRNRESERLTIQGNTKAQLEEIKLELHRLIEANEQAEQIQKIERDEFCLDLNIRNKLLGDGEMQVETIKKQAEYQTLEEELLHKNINTQTYSKLDSQLKSITGLVDNIIIFNFVIRKKEKSDNDRYRMISNLRLVEMTEGRWKKDHKVEDIIDLPTLIGTPEQYKEYLDQQSKAEKEMKEANRRKAIVDTDDKGKRRTDGSMVDLENNKSGGRMNGKDNSNPGQEERRGKKGVDLVLDNLERDREIDQERKAREVELQNFLQNYPDSKAIIFKPENFICNLNSGRQKKMLLLDHIKREEERQKIKAAALDYDKKIDNQDNTLDAPDRPAATGYRLHRMGRNPKGKRKNAGATMNMDDNTDEDQTDSSDQEADVDEEGKMDWEMMYGALELFTTKRKKSQILFLKNIIFKIKKAFNREFEAFFKSRNKQIEWINEQNTLIQELLSKLDKVEQNFKPSENIIDK